MQRLGLAVVVLTNQSAIGREYFDPDTLDRIHQRLRELLANDEASPDAIYVCPHHPDEGCSCRKPAPGLAWRAAVEFQANLSRSFVVGDKVCDIEMGKRVGATTILVRTGYGASMAAEGTAQADYVVDDLLEAAQLIQRLVVSGDGRRR